MTDVLWCKRAAKHAEVVSLCKIAIYDLGDRPTFCMQY